MKYSKLNNRQQIIKFKADMMSDDNACPARLKKFNIFTFSLIFLSQFFYWQIEKIPTYSKSCLWTALVWDLDGRSMEERDKRGLACCLVLRCGRSALWCADQLYLETV